MASSTVAARRARGLLQHLSSSTQGVAASSSLVAVHLDASGIAVLTMQSPPVNALSPALLEALRKEIGAAIKDPVVKGIVLVGRDTFCGGADIKNFGNIQSASEDTIRKGLLSDNAWLCSVEDNTSKPIVAAVQGFALGGGLELAMMCHERVSTKEAKFGLPELTLGIIPGMGGTQRLPRLVGTQKAVEMMLTSKPIGATEALELGLVDAIVPQPRLISKAIERALKLSTSNSAQWRRSLLVSDRVDPEEAKQVIQFAAQQAKKSAPNLTHPLHCLEAIEAGIIHGGKKGLEAECEAMVKCFTSPISKALIHIFLASKMSSKVPGVTVPPNKIHKVAVIGGGTMGSGIATALLLSGIHCYLKEINSKFLEAGMKRVTENLQRRVKSGRMSEEKLNHTLSMLKGTLTYDEFHEVDMVIEAAIEDLHLKQNIFADLEKACNSHCIFASNTSTLSIHAIGANTKAQDRMIGLHFFAPAHVMPLLEIVRTTSTSQQVISDSLGLAAKLHKTPIVVGNCIGFTVNRIFSSYSQASAFLVERGVDPYRIDTIIKKFGLPMGPHSMSDLSGLDIGAYTGNIFLQAYPDRVYKSTLGQHMVQAKRLGQKTSAGFYKYEGRKAVPDYEGIRPIIEAARKDAGNPQNIEISDEEIAQFLLFPIANEGLRVLEEEMAIRSSDIDIGSVYGYGFPAYRGGVMKWAEMEGFNKVAQKLQQWHSKFQVPFLKPCATLQKYL